MLTGLCASSRGCRRDEGDSKPARVCAYAATFDLLEGPQSAGWLVGLELRVVMLDEVVLRAPAIAMVRLGMRAR